MSPTTSSSPGRRHRRRGARARARRNQRAAAHQASRAEAATSVPLDPSPHRSLHLLPSPPSASGRRRVMSVGRPEMLTFSSLNLDGCSSPTPPPPPPICYDYCEIPRQHCDDCGKCVVLCYDHFGCDCEPPTFDPTEIECAICYCTREVKLM